VTPRDATFTPAASLNLLNAVCSIADLDPTGAHLMRHHTNAVYRLSRHQIIVKISRPGANRHRVAQAVAVAEALAETPVPGVRLWPGIEQPLSVDDSHATFWIAVKPTRDPVAEDLAEPLRQLHQLDPTALPPLPRLEPFTAVAESLKRRTVLPETDLRFLRDYAERLHDQYLRLTFEHPDRIIHGDAHHGNTLVGPGGPVLADWESACHGPPEWDLATLAVHCRRFGHPHTEYHDFATAYSRDIRSWVGYESLAAVRELRMITTNAWKANEGSAAASEVHRRVKALREGDDTITWRLL
jgi:aminoglycoside phosphotransferase (APT) family kinase protein